jgi:hypothetical protein
MMRCVWQLLPLMSDELRLKARLDLEAEGER